MDNERVSKWYLLLRSRKLWAAVVGVFMVMIHNLVPDFPIPEDQILALVALIMSYILGTALEDGLSNGRG